MKTNDIKKGMKFVMFDGYMGEMADNLKGNIRNVIVKTPYCPDGDLGSAYAHNIQFVYVGDTPELVEHTPAQLKLKKTVSKLGF